MKYLKFFYNLILFVFFVWSCTWYNVQLCKFGIFFFNFKSTLRFFYFENGNKCFGNNLFGSKWVYHQILTSENRQNTLRFGSYFNTKTNAHLSWRLGLTGENIHFKTLLKDKNVNHISSGAKLVFFFLTSICSKF